MILAPPLGVRRAAATLAMLACLLCAGADGLQAWAQCGGERACHQAGQRACPPGIDAPWPQQACPPGFACTRQDRYYWQCRNVRPSAQRATPLPTEAWWTAPRCNSDPTSRGASVQQDSQGRLWGWEGGASCTYKRDSGVAVYGDELVAAEAPSPSPGPKAETATRVQPLPFAEQQTPAAAAPAAADEAVPLLTALLPSPPAAVTVVVQLAPRGQVEQATQPAPTAAAADNDGSLPAVTPRVAPVNASVGTQAARLVRPGPPQGPPAASNASLPAIIRIAPLNASSSSSSQDDQQPGGPPPAAANATTNGIAAAGQPTTTVRLQPQPRSSRGDVAASAQQLLDSGAAINAFNASVTLTYPPGMPPDLWDAAWRQASRQAVADATGVLADALTETVEGAAPPPAAPPGGRRMLLQAPGPAPPPLLRQELLVRYGLPDGAAGQGLTQLLQGLASSNGSAVSAALARQGIPFQPAVAIGAGQPGAPPLLSVPAGSPPPQQVHSAIDVARRQVAARSMPAPAPAPEAAAPVAVLPPQGEQDSGAGLSGGAIAGIVIGAVVGAALLLAAAVCCCRALIRRKQRLDAPVKPLHSDAPLAPGGDYGPPLRVRYSTDADSRSCSLDAKAAAVAAAGGGRGSPALSPEPSGDLLIHIDQACSPTQQPGVAQLQPPANGAPALAPVPPTRQPSTAQAVLPVLQRTTSAELLASPGPRSGGAAVSAIRQLMSSSGGSSEAAAMNERQALHPIRTHPLDIGSTHDSSEDAEEVDAGGGWGSASEGFATPRSRESALSSGASGGGGPSPQLRPDALLSGGGPRLGPRSGGDDGSGSWSDSPHGSLARLNTGNSIHGFTETDDNKSARASSMNESEWADARDSPRSSASWASARSRRSSASGGSGTSDGSSGGGSTYASVRSGSSRRSSRG